MVKGFVIAGNHAQYRRWLLETGNNRQDYEYLSQPRVLRGRSFDETPQIIKVGSWWENPVSQDLDYVRTLIISSTRRKK